MNPDRILFLLFWAYRARTMHECRVTNRLGMVPPRTDVQAAIRCGNEVRVVLCGPSQYLLTRPTIEGEPETPKLAFEIIRQATSDAKLAQAVGQFCAMLHEMHGGTWIQVEIPEQTERRSSPRVSLAVPVKAAIVPAVQVDRAPGVIDEPTEVT